MTRVYGGCIEPGGMELDDEAYSIKCPECGRDAKRHDWEAADGGCINSYWSERCAHCGYADGNSDGGLDDDFDLPGQELDMKLADETYSVNCRECGREATRRAWEAEDLTPYWLEHCAHCRFIDSSDEGLYPTAVLGPWRAEWMTPVDLMALAKGQPCQVKP
ncbi:hypothetical protein LAV84_27770 [Rhizobium sp. VS19-DR104.2]|uniref:hypothetical protein n=1 Tax=Rhizobium/Agrobacterium group TaxID=227290 RepID=UPI001CC60138|nr:MULTISPECIES: hypothetical protein [unclassified Rhizobium]MBZ5763353.1 hypothetical protein [Rhizobium sp. VS19-DR96]MBZ5769248.1 hypothetical protein [Rhizobium sp. VS19-DR129.2]MBZ5776757.1 hypothetical protein [Rhizobium sp. VS19-DRK62.2]MBZ5786655.1 hypothetical protein [Rhizobium sp. VS19-DR121]MBZ5805306.1 hypothetical protein [Rhizobium sp. VS19-DR181]